MQVLGDSMMEHFNASIMQMLGLQYITYGRDSEWLRKTFSYNIDMSIRALLTRKEHKHSPAQDSIACSISS